MDGVGGGLCLSEVKHACETSALALSVHAAGICCVVLLPPEGFAEGGWGFLQGLRVSSGAEVVKSECAWHCGLHVLTKCGLCAMYIQFF